MKPGRKVITLAQRIDATEGRSTGFDYLRLGLAVSIVAWHAFATSYGLPWTYRFMAGSFRPLIAIILPMFFALSGFLVAGSLERSATLASFLALRALRIAPALTGEVLVSACVLGPVLTEAPLRDYFSDPLFRAYFLNVFGYIHYLLPGLFAHVPVPRMVNGQLWTIPRELACYAVLTILAILGIARRPTVLAIAIIIVGFALAAWPLLSHLLVRPTPGRLVGDVALLSSFLAGVALHGLRTSLPWSRAMFFACVAVGLLLLSAPGCDDLAVVPLAYATIYLGLLNPRQTLLVRGSDYSYGIFLYGWAVQQAVMTLGAWTHHWYVNLTIALPATILVAAVSWHGIEKPALRLRAFVPRLEWRLVSSRVRYTRRR